MMKDTTFTKMFVGGLPYHTSSETLRQFFEKFGNIQEAVVMTDRLTGKSNGYGFVSFNILFYLNMLFCETQQDRCPTRRCARSMSK